MIDIVNSWLKKDLIFKNKNYKIEINSRNSNLLQKQGLVDKKKDLINSPPKDTFYFSESAVRSKNN